MVELTEELIAEGTSTTTLLLPKRGPSSKKRKLYGARKCTKTVCQECDIPLCKDCFSLCHTKRIIKKRFLWFVTYNYTISKLAFTPDGTYLYHTNTHAYRFATPILITIKINVTCKQIPRLKIFFLILPIFRDEGVK